MVRINVGPRLRTEMWDLAAGRALVIDYVASARCGVVVGDITAAFRAEQSAVTYTKLTELEGVAVYAEARLVSLLDEAGPSLDLQRLPFGLGRRVQVTLERPERWLDFLERPGIARR